MTSQGEQALGWESHSTATGSGTISYEQAGSGARTILALPRENGHPPRRDAMDTLAKESRIVYPWLPVFHGCNPGEWDWLNNPRDLAVVLLQFIDALGVERPALLGFGFGGWLAAEMATMAGRAIEALMLVAPMGILPPQGYIYDQFLVSTETYARTGFASQANFEAIYGAEPDFDQLERWETDREMTSRIAWKPYMYNPALPRLLAGVRTPTLVLRGDADEIVPPGVGDAYLEALPNAQLDVIAGGGHALELEQPAAVASRVARFLQRL
jgi:pimeloyl-ACP methyl ester carboxylesterase